MSSTRKLLLAAVLLSGCGPQVSLDELGTIEYEVPRFDPDEQKYPLPRLGEPSDPDSAENSHEKHSHDHGTPE